MYSLLSLPIHHPWLTSSLTQIILDSHHPCLTPSLTRIIFDSLRVCFPISFPFRRWTRVYLTHSHSPEGLRSMASPSGEKNVKTIHPLVRVSWPPNGSASNGPTSTNRRLVLIGKTYALSYLRHAPHRAIAKSRWQLLSGAGLRATNRLVNDWLSN